MTILLIGVVLCLSVGLVLWGYVRWRDGRVDLDRLTNRRTLRQVIKSRRADAALSRRRDEVAAELSPRRDELAAELRCLEEAKTQLTGPPASDSEGWLRQITPPLPLSWPGDADQRAAIYGYAMRSGYPMLVDAVWVSKLYARILLDPLGRQAPQSEPLREDIGEQTPQGVRPLTAAEQEILDGSDVAKGLLLAALGRDAASELDATVVSYYNLWRSTNGVIAKAVLNGHREFFAALDRFEA